MKFSFFNLAAALLFSLFFYSCSKKEARPVDSANQSTLSYEVNGTLIQCNVMSIDEGTGITGDISVNGNDSTSDKHGISLLIRQNTVGDSALYAIFIRYHVDFLDSWGGATQESDAVVNVTVNNPEKVKGTFSGRFPNLNLPSRHVMITNGQFEVFR